MRLCPVVKMVEEDLIEINLFDIIKAMLLSILFSKEVENKKNAKHNLKKKLKLITRVFYFARIFVVRYLLN